MRVRVSFDRGFEIHDEGHLLFPKTRNQSALLIGLSAGVATFITHRILRMIETNVLLPDFLTYGIIYAFSLAIVYSLSGILLLAGVYIYRVIQRKHI